MMWKIMGPAALALAMLSPVVPAAAAMQADAGSSQTMAEVIAAGLQEMVGKPDENGFMMVSAEAQGNVLIVLVTGPAGWREEVSGREASDLFVDGFCTEAAMLFDGKFAIRVDSIDREVTELGPLVTACPASRG